MTELPIKSGGVMQYFSPDSTAAVEVLTIEPQDVALVTIVVTGES
jgi:hypothetical protein